MKTITIDEAVKMLKEAYAVSVHVPGSEREEEVTFHDVSTDTSWGWAEFLWLSLDETFHKFFVDQNREITVEAGALWLTDSAKRQIRVKLLTLKSLE